MITLHVLTHKGTSLPKPVVMEFDLRGGTIGRADSNKLVLPDPTVSRVHAQIVNRQGTFIIISRGRNPIFVNDVGIEAGDELPLDDGARVQIGECLVQVALAKAHAAAAAGHHSEAQKAKANGEAFGGL